MSAELIVRGGTVVTASGRRRSDIALEGGRITAVEDVLPESAEARPQKVLEAFVSVWWVPERVVMITPIVSGVLPSRLVYVNESRLSRAISSG